MRNVYLVNSEIEFLHHWGCCSFTLGRINQNWRTIIKNFIVIWLGFFPQQRAPCSHWLLRVTLATSNNNTVSLQKFLSREHCKIYDVKSIHSKGKCGSICISGFVWRKTNSWSLISVNYISIFVELELKGNKANTYFFHHYYASFHN